MKIRIIIDWILQTILIATFILIIIDKFILSFQNSISNIILLSLFFFFWIIYQINSVTSEIFLFLLYFKPKLNLFQYMENIFNSKPLINLFIDCYHFEDYVNNSHTHLPSRLDEHNEQKDQNVLPLQDEININYINNNNNFRKIITFQDKKEFIYTSTKDVSGIFTVGGNKTNFYNKKPSLLKLKLTLIIVNADEETDLAYTKFKKDIYEQHSKYDTYISVTDKFEIEGMNEYNLISVNNNDNILVNYLIYILLTLICLIEFYKMYLESKCISQEFEIKKVISVKESINNINNFREIINPTIIVGEETGEYCNESHQILYKLLKEEDEVGIKMN